MAGVAVSPDPDVVRALRARSNPMRLQLLYLLSRTEQMHVINGIAKIWSRAARWTHGASLLLADAYPNRHVLGLGVGDARLAAVTPPGAGAG
jgi:hypothetical protein